MDFIAHALWTLLLFDGYEWKWWAVLLGFLADAITWLPIMLILLSRREKLKGPPASHGTFVAQWSKLYNATHSLPVLLFVALLIFLLTKRFWWPLMGWLLHILMDIPSHSKEKFPTPFLWPFSTYTINGVRWDSHRFLIVNYTLLVLGYLFLVAWKFLL